MSDAENGLPAMCCENCRWWDDSQRHGNDPQEVTGLCRRRAPRINKITGMAFWPFTEDSDWCGSFSASDEALKGCPPPF